MDWVAKPLRSDLSAAARAVVAAREAAEAGSDPYGVHPDDFARKGQYTSERVSCLLSAMAGDRRLKDFGLSVLHDAKRRVEARVRRGRGKRPVL